jgi:hypothetical protein
MFSLHSSTILPPKNKSSRLNATGIRGRPRTDTINPVAPNLVTKSGQDDMVAQRLAIAASLQIPKTIPFGLPCQAII